jgi:hypothetical protein
MNVVEADPSSSNTRAKKVSPVIDIGQGIISFPSAGRQPTAIKTSLGKNK